MKKARWAIGWTENDDKDWEGLVWDGHNVSELALACERAKALARSNSGWTFIVYDTNEDADDFVPFVTSADKIA